MGKKLLLSLFVASFALPFFTSNVIAYPSQQGASPCAQDMPPYHDCAGASQSPMMQRQMHDPKFLEMVQPIREANRALFNALEVGNIKAIQASAKQFASAMKNVQSPEIKKQLTNAIRLADMMATGSPTYRELLSTYALIKRETSSFHFNRRTYNARSPRLMLDTKTYSAVITAEEQMQILINSLSMDNETAINAKIDTLAKTLKTIKTPQLQDYINPLLTTLSDMKSAKTVMAKTIYRQMVIGRTSQLAMITKEKE